MPHCQLDQMATDMCATCGTGDDRSFLLAVVLGSSAVAVAAQFLPGDWGFFVPYLTGGVSIAVLAIGSTAPGLLQFFISKFASLNADYRERTLRHEVGTSALDRLMGTLAMPCAALRMYLQGLKELAALHIAGHPVALQMQPELLKRRRL